MNNLDIQIAKLNAGQDSQFGPVLQIPAASLVAGVYKEFDLPLTASTLWLPQYAVVGDALVGNPAALVIGVKINSSGAPTLPWGRGSSFISRFNGAVNRIFVTLLAGSAAPVYLMSARNVEVFYAGNDSGAGTPDNATTNGILGD